MRFQFLPGHRASRRNRSQQFEAPGLFHALRIHVEHDGAGIMLDFEINAVATVVVIAFAFVAAMDVLLVDLGVASDAARWLWWCFSLPVRLDLL